jgi:hypothetical protein
MPFLLPHELPHFTHANPDRRCGVFFLTQWHAGHSTASDANAQKTLEGVHIFYGSNIRASGSPTHAQKTPQTATFSSATAPNPLTFSTTNQKTTKPLQTSTRFARKHDFARDVHSKGQKTNGPKVLQRNPRETDIFRQKHRNITNFRLRLAPSSERQEKCCETGSRNKSKICIGIA